MSDTKSSAPDGQFANRLNSGISSLLDAALQLDKPGPLDFCERIFQLRDDMADYAKLPANG